MSDTTFSPANTNYPEDSGDSFGHVGENSGSAHQRPYPKKDFTSTHTHGSVLNFSRCEEDILRYWDSNNTFQLSLTGRTGAPEYIFYDGPPFANGLPHYGHLLTGYVKDIIPRYKTMQGYLVQRRFGWDTHGLPAELEAQRQLEIKDISEIEKLGIDKFNEYCQSSVLHYADQWRSRVNRQARWVDFNNDYKTLDITFMESVMWAFKTLYDKGLIYQGYKVLPYSWSEQTPLSNQEARMDDATRARQDPAVSVKLPVTSSDSPLCGANLIVWTTTPWTLTTNLAVGVHPDIEYVHLETQSGERYIMGKTRYQLYAQELGEDVHVLGTYVGSQLVGLEYEPPFDFFIGHPHAHKIYPAEYITDDSGTGLVHLAPFGEEDVEVYEKVGIPLIVPVDKFGNFTEDVPPYAGKNIFEANPLIIKDLKKADKILRHETIEHAYPHSWRSGEPLIYMPVPSWFVKVTDIKPRMIELNKNITWIPEHLRDGQFGKWLENARDWNISRNRYWGSPIPVWLSDNPHYPRIDVYGSLAELERDFGVRPDNLHRPYIDQLTRPNPDDPTGQSMMRRVPEVLDCWFESGSMPFAAVHYPFENEQWFHEHFPGDFIVEYHGQTRGWFYNLLVMSTALFDQAPFRTAATHGIILGTDGLKMSKSKRNYPPVEEIFDTLGADAMRWYLTSSQLLRGGNLSVTSEGLTEGLRQTILPLWNSYSFFILYAEQYAHISWDSPDILDQYIIAKLAQTRDIMTAAMDNALLAEANAALRDFVEILTNWYIRRSRQRFWEGSEKHPEAFNTLYTVLETLLRLSAPLLPYVSEALWLGLTGGNSVHLQDWPTMAGISRNEPLVTAMDMVREICSAAVSIRKAQKLRVRLPLAELIIAGEFADQLSDFVDLIADEVNVKTVTLTNDKERYGKEEIVVNARITGPRLGKDVQQAIKAAKSGQWTKTGDQVNVGGILLEPGEYDIRLNAVDPAATAKVAHGAGLVVLDVQLTPELVAEGWVKDRIRQLQEMRKSSGFDISDRIILTLWVAEEKYDWVTHYLDLFTHELLATRLDILHVSDGVSGCAEKLGDEMWAYCELAE